jgi:hypothetical protein
MSVSISVLDTFDGGNVKFTVQTPNLNDPSMNTRIRPDVYTELENITHMQYFRFHAIVSGLEEGGPQKVKYSIENAHAILWRRRELSKYVYLK